MLTRLAPAQVRKKRAELEAALSAAQATQAETSERVAALRAERPPSVRRAAALHSLLPCVARSRPAAALRRTSATRLQRRWQRRRRGTRRCLPR